MDQNENAGWQSDAMISLRNLRVSYASGEILHGITFDVMRGETLVILAVRAPARARFCGPSWVWKSQLPARFGSRVRIIAAISAAEMDEIARKSDVVPRRSAVRFRCRWEKNVALPLREHTKLEDSTIEIILRLKLDQVGLAGFENYMLRSSAAG